MAASKRSISPCARSRSRATPSRWSRPAFYGLLQILESLGLRALEILTSATTGLSVEALELALHAYANIKAVVVVPHLQNPLGSRRLRSTGSGNSFATCCASRRKSHEFAYTIGSFSMSTTLRMMRWRDFV